jgi:hypothetical protein
MGEIRDIRRKPRPDINHMESSKEVVFALQGGGATSQNSLGCGWKTDICFTLNATDVHGIAYEIHNTRTPSE